MLLERNLHLEETVSVLEDDDYLENGMDDWKESLPALHRAPLGWFPPSCPPGWSYKKHVTIEEPDFEDVDNPGDWDPYCFVAKHKKVGRSKIYSHHELPTKCRVVPKDECGDRKVGDF